MKDTNLKSQIFDVVGFGYLFVMILVVVLKPSEDQMMNLGLNSMIVLGCLILAYAFQFLLAHYKIKSLGVLIFEPPHKKATETKSGLFNSFWGYQLLVLFFVTLIASMRVTQFSIDELLYIKGLEGAQRIFGALFTPNFDVLPRGVLAIIETIYMAFLATIIAVPVAFLLSFLCAKNIMDKTVVGTFVYFTLRVVMNIARSIEPLIWAIIFSVWVGIGPFAGMLALMIHTVASLTKQYSEQIECVEDGPVEGVQSTGANPLQVIWFAIVPQIVLPFISFTIFRWDINVRMATIIGLVGGGGIGTILMNYQGQALWHEVGTLALLIIIVVWAMDAASAYLREALK